MGKNSKGISTGAVVGIVIVVVIIGAVGAYYATKGPAEEAKGKVGLMLATGGLGDRSFNDQSYWGAKDAAEDLDVKLDYVEPREIAEYEGYQRDFAETGEYDIIVCIGFDQAPILDNVAKDYPNQNFAVVDAVATGANNVASLVFNDWEEAFLVGVVAGKMTEANMVGIEGGMDIPLIRRFVQGFRQGALWANLVMDNEDVLVRYVGAWNDPTTGKSLAEEMYNGGADIIYGAAGKSHLGVFQAAEDSPDRWAIGTDVDQAWSAPEHADVILASGLKRVDLAVYDQIEKAVKNNFEPGIISYGMTEGAVGFGTGIAVGDENINKYIRASQSEVDIPESVIDSVKDAVEGIKDGTITIEHD